MPGKIHIMPKEAYLTHNTSFLSSMNPYFVLITKDEKIQGEICNKGGSHPHWQADVSFDLPKSPFCIIEIKDKKRIGSDSLIGKCKIDLKEIESKGNIEKWIQLNYGSKEAGCLHLHAYFEPENIEKKTGTEVTQDFSTAITEKKEPNSLDLDLDSISPNDTMRDKIFSQHSEENLQRGSEINYEEKLNLQNSPNTEKFIEDTKENKEESQDKLPRYLTEKLLNTDSANIGPIIETKKRKPMKWSREWHAGSYLWEPISKEDLQAARKFSLE